MLCARPQVFVVLSEATIAEVLRRLLKLDWSPDTQRYVLKCLMKVRGGKGAAGGGSAARLPVCLAVRAWRVACLTVRALSSSIVA